MTVEMENFEFCLCNYAIRKFLNILKMEWGIFRKIKNDQNSMVASFI